MTPAALTPNRKAQDFSKNFLWLLVGGIVYFLLAKLGMTVFSLHPSNITLLWLPAGIGMVMSRHQGHKAAPVIFAASFAANFTGLATDSLLKQIIHTSISAGADTLAAALSAYLMKRTLSEGLNKFSHLFRFILAVCLVPTFLSAMILATNLVVGNYVPSKETISFITMLLFADSLGILLVYPLFEAWRSNPTIKGLEWQTAIVSTAMLFFIAYLAFNYVSGLIYLIFPFLLFVSFHSNDREVYLSLLLSLCFIIASASSALGPFNMATIEQSYFMLLTFLFTTAIVTVGTRLQQIDLLNENKVRRNWMFLANHDALTGLANRLLFIPMIEKEIARSQRKHNSFSLAIIDIDKFKSINDNYGHLVGDKVIKSIAATLRESLRTIDVAARIGGEEFAILFPETTIEEAAQALERIRISIESLKIDAGSETISPTISGGLTQSSLTGTLKVDEILNRADQLLYEAKNLGRNRICVSIN